MRELLIPGEIFRPKFPWGPGSDGGYWLNPGIAKIWGKTIIVYRLNRMPSVLVLSVLGDDLEVVESRHLFELSANGVIPEDPRLFVDGDRLGVFFVGIYDNPSCAMYRAEIDSTYQVMSKKRMAYNDGSPERMFIRAYTGVVQQKNWVPFFHDGKLLSIYDHAPFTIITHDGSEAALHHAGPNLRWRYGAIRGGAPPVKRDGLWYSFFHSSTEHRAKDGRPVKVYYVGCYSFDDNFEIKAMTPEPIMAGHPDCYSDPWAFNCHLSAVFPCGVLSDDAGWLLSYGYLDAHVRFARIRHDDILSRMQPVKPVVDVTSYRDSVAYGKSEVFHAGNDL